MRRRNVVADSSRMSSEEELEDEAVPVISFVWSPLKSQVMDKVCGEEAVHLVGPSSKIKVLFVLNL